MNITWLDDQDSWFIVALLLVAMMIAAEVAYRVGRRLNPHAAEAGKAHFGAVVGSLLGLLALLLSFTFGMSAQRYEARRLLLIEDANTIGTFYLHTSLLPEPQRHVLKPLLLQYVDLRAQPIPLQHNEPEFADRETRSRALLIKMWNISRDMALSVPAVKGSDEVVLALMDLVASHSRRLSAEINLVPDSVIWMLLGAATAGMAVIGYSAGLGNHRGIPARIMLSLLVCGTIYVILDLDRPNRGLIKMDQGPMIRMQNVIDQDPESH